MALAITLRNSLGTNLFRNTLIATINAGIGDSAILCSGFFQENFKNSAYQASLEPNFINALKKLKTLKTIGIHNNTWRPSYIAFRDNLLAAGVNINAYYKSGLKWHAKVFVLLREETPIFGIIGSSNITANAFGASDSPNPPLTFNHECDVYFWVDAETALDGKLNELLHTDRLSDQVIWGEYDVLNNFGKSEEQRLKELIREINSSKLVPLV